MLSKNCLPVKNRTNRPINKPVPKNIGINQKSKGKTQKYIPTVKPQKNNADQKQPTTQESAKPKTNQFGFIPKSKKWDVCNQKILLPNHSTKIGF